MQIDERDYGAGHQGLQQFEDHGWHAAGCGRSLCFLDQIYQVPQIPVHDAVAHSHHPTGQCPP